MTPLLENDIISFYQDCDYWPIQVMPLRPREMHIPHFLAMQFQQNPGSTIFDSVTNKELKCNVDPNSSEIIAPVLLHESLFHFYKAFYNYLAARALYFNGQEHWIKITLYYAQFYLARSITVLCGKQKYYVEKDKNFFSSSIASLLTKSGKQPPNSYRVNLDINLPTKSGFVIVDNDRVSSHKDVWEDYRQLSVDNFGIYKLIFDEMPNKDKSTFEIPWNHILQERHEENYSFEGYWTLDFNIPTQSFKSFYNDIIRHLKNIANTLYDLDSCPVLLAFSSQYRLYKKLNIPKLPIEQEKFLYMIETYLPDSKAKDNLCELCREGFPTEDLHSPDGETFYDQHNRAL